MNRLMRKIAAAFVGFGIYVIVFTDLCRYALTYFHHWAEGHRRLTTGIGITWLLFGLAIATSCAYRSWRRSGDQILLEL